MPSKPGQRFDGLMARVNALGKLPWLPSLFLFLLFLAIETSPIIAKLLSPKGSYDLKLAEQEGAVASWVAQQKAQREVLVTTDREMNNRVYADIAEEDELYQYKRKKARELMHLVTSITLALSTLAILNLRQVRNSLREK